MRELEGGQFTHRGVNSYVSTNGPGVQISLARWTRGPNTGGVQLYSDTGTYQSLSGSDCARTDMGSGPYTRAVYLV